MMINEILRLKFPLADFTTDIILQDNGKGIYIAEWHIEGVDKPDQPTLDKWALEVQPLHDQKQKDIQNKPIRDQLLEIDLKSIRALRAGETERLTSLELEAEELRGQLV